MYREQRAMEVLRRERFPGAKDGGEGRREEGLPKKEMQCGGI